MCLYIYIIYKISMIYVSVFIYFNFNFLVFWARSPMSETPTGCFYTSPGCISLLLHPCIVETSWSIGDFTFGDMSKVILEPIKPLCIPYHTNCIWLYLFSLVCSSLPGHFVCQKRWITGMWITVAVLLQGWKWQLQAEIDCCSTATGLKYGGQRPKIIVLCSENGCQSLKITVTGLWMTVSGLNGSEMWL